MSPDGSEPRLDLRITSRFLGVLALGQLWLFAPATRFFFQGDGLFWLYHRYRSWSDFASAFLTLDSYGWYRPLGHGLLPTLLYPVFGLDPTGFHWVVLLLFIGTTWVVFFLLWEMSHDWLAAAAATFFFGVHPVNVFVTFDHGFGPELLYGLFCALSTLFLVSWIRTRKFLHYGLSVLFLLFGLFSKEAAFLLPVTLLWVCALVGEGRGGDSGWKMRLLRSGGNLWLHWLAVLGYGLVGVFLLRPGGPGIIPAGGYSLEFGRNLPENFWQACLLGLNLPGAWTDTVNPSVRIGGFLQVPIVVGLCLTTVGMLRKGGGFPRRLLLPVVWFLTTLTPALFVSDLKPYYIYVPLMGGALWVGRSASWIYREWLRGSGVTVRLLGVVPLLVVLGSSWLVVGAVRENHSLLGVSSRVASQAVRDANGLRDRLAAARILLLLDPPEAQLWWRYAGGKLFKMYFNEALDVRFSSSGATVSTDEIREGVPLVVLKAERGRLMDVTDAFLTDPDTVLPAMEGAVDRKARPVKLWVEPSVIRRGSGSYQLRLGEFAGETVLIQFSRDAGPVSHFRVSLDRKGEARFFVSSETAPGLYRFLAVRRTGGDRWVLVRPATLLIE